MIPITNKFLQKLFVTIGKKLYNKSHFALEKRKSPFSKPRLALHNVP